MKNIYLSSSLMWGQTLDEIFDTLHKNDIKGIELWAEQFEYFEFDVQKYITLAEQHNVKTVVHSKSWDLNFASLNKGIRQASLEQIKQSIDLANLIKCDCITIHPARQTVNDIDPNNLTHLRNGLSELNEYATSKGVKISLEIMEKIPKELITSDQALFKILGDMVDNFTYTLDIAHCVCEDEIWTYLKTIKNIDKLHVSNKKGTKLHTDMDDGDFDFNIILPKLMELNLPTVIEGLDKSNKNIIINKTLKQIKEIIKC